MKFSQNELHDLLLACPGEKRQFFAESTHALGVSIVNGRIEPLSRTHTQGVSLLVTSNGNKFFESRESFLDWKSVFHGDFGARGIHGNSPMQWSPENKDYVFAEPEMLTDIQSLLASVQAPLERLRSIPWIQSTSVGIGIREIQYLAVSSYASGGIDSQRQYRLFIMATGEKDGIIQEYYDAISSNGVMDRFSSDRIEKCFSGVQDTLEKLLGATPAPSGEMDVVIAAEAGGVIIHEAVGHGLEGDLQGSSVYSGKIGQKVASEKVTIVDDPTLPGLRGTYEIDHEGIPAERTVLIEKGILKNYLHQHDTSEFLNLPGNGHCRRENYAFEPIVRMSNTYMDNGSDTLDAMIQSVSDGILVTSLGGGQVNTASGDFVFKVNFGYRIRNGAVAEVIRGANLSGNGPEMLQTIRMVGNDLTVGSHEYYVGGTCGKDGQGMPVTDANPSMLVRLKVTG